MWQMKEWFLKFVVQAVWRRRKLVYYAVSLVSIAGNLVLLLGPSLQASILLRSGALQQAAWIALPLVAKVVLHRSVLYILLNLIVARILVKSGMLGQTSAGMPTKLDEFCPPSSYYVVRGLPWPANNTCTVYGTQSAPGVHMFTDPSMSLHQARGDDQNKATMDVCAQTSARQISKSCDDEQPKCAPAPSLFTIEPLNELVQVTESYIIYDEQAHIAETLEHPLRKVASRVADLHCSLEAHAGTLKGSMKAERLQQKNEQSLQLDLGKQDVEVDKANGAAELHDDNRLSRQEFNERVDTFIVKFKRNLTMQRQDSFNRLLGLVGGGGDIRLIK